MSGKKIMRKVNNGICMFTFMGTEYVIERRGFEGRMVEVFYNSRTGKVDKVRSEELGESKVHPAVFKNLSWEML